MKNTELLQKTKALVKIEQKTTYQVLKHLEQIEKRKAFCQLGFSSLFLYCTKSLKYSEKEAYYRINSMRLMRTDKKIEKKIEKQDLSLTKAARLQTQKRQQNLSKQETFELVEKVQDMTTRQMELELKPMVEEILTVRLKASAASKLLKVKKLIGDYKDEEIIEILLDQKLREYQKERAGSLHSRHISKALKYRVFQRAKHTCEHEKCQEKRFLHIDHIIPHAKGGLNEFSNLRVLCANHNQYERLRCFQ